MLNMRINSAISSARRFAHTRAKRVDVQLLKGTYGRRFQGEIFPVSEGHMRLKLHPEGIAAYVLKNEPTPIPVLPAAEAQRLRKEAQQRAKLEAAEAARVDLESKKQETSERDVEQKKIQTLIDALDFPTAEAPPEDAASEATEESAKEVEKKEEPKTEKKFAWQSDFVANISEKKR